MTSGEPQPVVLDHGFPRPIVELLDDFGLFPDVTFHFTRDIDKQLADWPDDQLVRELHRRGFSVFLTADHKMLRNEAVLVAIAQTWMTVLAVRSAAHDALLCTGVLLRDLIPVLKRDQDRGLIYEASPSQVSPKRPWQRLREVAEKDETAYDVWHRHALPLEDRRRYPENDPRRIV